MFRGSTDTFQQRERHTTNRIFAKFHHYTNIERVVIVLLTDPFLKSKTMMWSPSILYNHVLFRNINMSWSRVLRSQFGLDGGQRQYGLMHVCLSG